MSGAAKPAPSSGHKGRTLEHHVPSFAVPGIMEPVPSSRGGKSKTLSRLPRSTVKIPKAYPSLRNTLCKQPVHINRAGSHLWSVSIPGKGARRVLQEKLP